MTKVAREMGLSAGHGRFLAMLYNAGRTDLQRMTSDTPQEKAAAFALADPEAVHNRLMSGKIAAVSGPDPSYQLPPYAVRDILAAEKPLPTFPAGYKTAAVAEPPPQSPSFLQVHSDISREQNLVSRYKVAAATADRDLERGIDVLGRQLRQSDAPTIATLRKMASVVPVSPAFEPVLKLLIATYPPIEKRAAAPDLSQRTTAERSAFAECVKLAGIYEARDAAAIALGETIEKSSQKVAELVHSVAPVIDTGPFAEQNNAVPFAKAADMGVPWSSVLPGMMAGRAAAPRTGAGPDPAAVKGWMHAMDDPRHAQLLGGIQARTAVERMMASDPVLQGYHPDDILAAYNELSASAPNAIQQPLYAQAMLRRMLGQGGLDPSDVTSNVMKTENDLVKRQAMPTPGVEPSPGVPSQPRALDRFVGAVSPFMPQSQHQPQPERPGPTETAPADADTRASFGVPV